MCSQGYDKVWSVPSMQVLTLCFRGGTRENCGRNSDISAENRTVQFQDTRLVLVEMFDVVSVCFVYESVKFAHPNISTIFFNKSWAT
jgi:hypothetical protein